MVTQNLDSVLASLKSALADDGLLLCDIQSLRSLPDSVWLQPCLNEGDASNQVIQLQNLKSGSLLLIGHAGKKFWDVFQSRTADEVMLKPDPVDRYSRDITAEALEKHLPNINKWLLFPADDCPINLMALGRAFNWHTPSPLGMGIHWNYGLWSAYRAVWWVDVECEGLVSESQVKSPATDICSQCQTQECVASCPADAIQYRENPDLSSCADYRLQDSSQCESTCLARMACPYAGEHRYTEQQMAYHYELSRSSIADYRREKQQQE